MRSGHSTTQTVRYWRMLRVSDTADDENRKTCWPIPVAGSMRHDGEGLFAQFSWGGQRVGAAPRGKTARGWMGRESKIKKRQNTRCSSLAWLKLLLGIR